MTLSGKKALVTGAARGIGRGCAVELARAGADVCVNDLRASPELDETLAAIRALGRSAWPVVGDVFERTGCEAVLTAALAQAGHVDALVSNPAYSRRAAFLEYPAELWDQTLRGTLSSGFHMSQLVARHLVARQARGKIIFISSVQARIPFAGSVAYNAAKAGLIHMAETIANELLPYRINVNTIEPGWIDTPGEQAVFGAETIAQEGPKLPWGRLGTPEDIGRAAAFLCSEAADYITGTSLLVDGGFALRRAQ